MKEFTVKLERVTYHSTTVVVRAESEIDAEDQASDLFYQDDGCHKIRERMEFSGSVLNVKTESTNPVGTAETVSTPF